VDQEPQQLHGPQHRAKRSDREDERGDPERVARNRTEWESHLVLRGVEGCAEEASRQEHSHENAAHDRKLAGHDPPAARRTAAHPAIRLRYRHRERAQQVEYPANSSAWQSDGHR